MPHSISSFFRSHTNSTNSYTPSTELKRRPSITHKRPEFSHRAPSSSASSLASDDMPDSHKRLSLTNLISAKSSSKSIPQHKAASLDIVIESPPVVLYGPAASSTGALLSGQLKLNIQEDTLSIEKLAMKLNVEVTRKKPFHGHCPECLQQKEKLIEWNFLAGPATLRRGVHDFPFSFLMPGHLPATMMGSISQIEYNLRASVITKDGDTIKLSKLLDVKRAIFAPEEPKKSIRIFPPTTITVHCNFPAVIHPVGEGDVSLRVDGVVKRNLEAQNQNQWKFKRVIWRLEETEKAISPACLRHAIKLTGSDEAKKGTPHQDTRTIGTGEIKTGWKGDYTTADGRVELDFPISVNGDQKPRCDLKSEDGTEVSHVLVVEIIVGDEYAPIKNPAKITPTGAARVLRMHFNIILSERAGMGISWDEERPPLYEDVPASPPGYINTYEGPPIPDYEDLSPLDVRDDTPFTTLADRTRGSEASQ